MSKPSVTRCDYCDNTVDKAAEEEGWITIEVDGGGIASCYCVKPREYGNYRRNLATIEGQVDFCNIEHLVLWFKREFKLEG